MSIASQLNTFVPTVNVSHIVSYMYDKWGLIKKGSKDSPADMPNKIYEFMKKHRTVYDEQERRLYKDWLEKQGKN